MYKSIMYQFLQNLNQESLEDSVNVLLFFWLKGLQWDWRKESVVIRWRFISGGSDYSLAIIERTWIKEGKSDEKRSFINL